MSSSPAEAATRLEAAARDALAAAEELIAADATSQASDLAVQQLLTAGTRLFARKVELERRYFLPVTEPGVLTPTEAAVTVTEMLQAVNLNLFDLSMWSTRPRD